MNHWINNAIFYHIYPLGALGAPRHNALGAPPENRLQHLPCWLDHIQALGANALYLGPLFESTTHGYDTANYYEVDRRLGTRADLAALSADMHQRGMHLVLDGVFNHVGRDFWAFRDVQANGENSSYRDWFHNLRFDQSSPLGDRFSYESWNGHYSLAKLNLENPAVREHLFRAIEMWVNELGMDGIRLDAADSLSFSFLEALSAFRNQFKPDLWLMGEVIHGDYRQWVNPACLDSVTNYELYKGLYSSHNSANYFELAYSLARQFAEGGIYEQQKLYTFVDNHDVMRIASQLTHPAHLFPLHLLLYTVPGVPSIYYGSEFGLNGAKDGGNDAPLRPALDLPALKANPPQAELSGFISRLAGIRQASQALRDGDYTQLHVASQQFTFLRQAGTQQMCVAVNSSCEAVSLQLNLPHTRQGMAFDLLSGEDYRIENGQLQCVLHPNYGRILEIR